MCLDLPALNEIFAIQEITCLYIYKWYYFINQHYEPTHAHFGDDSITHLGFKLWHLLW